MVGIFSRFSVSRASHRRTQSAIDEREVLPPNSEVTGAATAAATASHGIEVAVEFKPVEHPMEPLDNDRPIQCPLPEPSILNDGRIWKERVSATVPRRGDLPVMMEGGSLEPEGSYRFRDKWWIVDKMSTFGSSRELDCGFFICDFASCDFIVEVVYYALMQLLS